MEFVLKVLSITEVTHDVRCIRIEKPAGYSFIPGQATEVAINKPGWEAEKRSFTFTSLNDDPYLEFTIKCYTDHPGVTGEIRHLKIGDELIIDEAWGAIEYTGEGFFIAGGAGITPFIAILRQLYKDNKLGNNKLFFSNKTPADIIYEKELSAMLGDNAVYVLTSENGGTYLHDFIDETFLGIHIDDYTRHFYICGPDKMITSISEVLTSRGAKPDAVIFEK
ncbi:FAD-binding oxidoreductase [Chitinophaga sp. MM2321]|uniref:FAD-binding oxidoreductase n=1 Tax=Chitinophaga sp. MM2321 TaxID=3137178 RepID=UPI0032D56CC6